MSALDDLFKKEEDKTIAFMKAFGKINKEGYMKLKRFENGERRPTSQSTKRVRLLYEYLIFKNAITEEGKHVKNFTDNYYGITRGTHLYFHSYKKAKEFFELYDLV